MFQERCYERDFDVNNNFYADNMENNIDYNYNNTNNNMENTTMSGGCNNPIVEQMQERVVNRTIMHEVPQDYPFMSYELMINKYKLKSYYEIIFTFIITLFILLFHP